jgi:hypothetical protein
MKPKIHILGRRLRERDGLATILLAIVAGVLGSLSLVALLDLSNIQLLNYQRRAEMQTGVDENQVAAEGNPVLLLDFPDRQQHHPHLQ